MSATAGDLPDGPGWAYEMGWDGPRVLVEVAGADVRVLDAGGGDADGGDYDSGNSDGGNCDGGSARDPDPDAGDPYGDPEGDGAHEAGVADGRRAGARRADSELALSWADGISDAVFDGHLIRLTGSAAVVFVAGDLLRLYGVDLRERTYAERRDTLERLAAARPGLAVSPRFDDADATDTAARQHGLPGVVAKRLDSRYRSGRRSPDWIERRFDADRSRG